MEAPKAGDVSCSPTWAQPSADGRSVFVACNKANDIVEIDATAWTLKRRIPAGDGVYNLAVTRDGKLLVGTNKRGKSVSIIDLASGKELARIPTQRRVVHGVAISTDDRYAFFTSFFENFFNTDENLGSRLSEEALRANTQLAYNASPYASVAAQPTWLTDFRADVDAMARVWDDEQPDDLTCVHPGWPPLRGRATVLRSWSAVMATTDYIQFFLTDVETAIRGDVASVTCSENVLTADEDTDASSFGGGKAVATNVFVRTPNGWRLWIHHASPVVSGGHDDHE